ncbi:MAG: ABC transporter permease [Deltaproteobacteria bacterium]|nr:ABC transporter permease [Deltaproteobacteria bacterium]MBW2137534.1 ABC transporter permease [Deltaproteobacteria bacterium]
MYLRIAWRNIWRNPRRTMVMVTAVVVGVWSMICLGALMRGMVDQMIRNGISTLTGHLQIHSKGYREDPVVENSISDPERVLSLLKERLPVGALWTTRVRVSAVVANARHSSGVTLVGIMPDQEAEVSFIYQAVSEGRYLGSGDRNGILLGEALADKFETRLGRKLVLMSQDASGEIASRAFRIVGIFKAEMEATEEQYVFVKLSSAQEMLKMGEGISEISIMLSERKSVGQVAEVLRGALDPSIYDVHTWEEVLPMVAAIQKLYDWFIFIWYLVVFIAMGFGIVNTTLMAVFERIREFGLLKALGMRPGRIVKGVLTETSFLLLVGMMIGNIVGFVTIALLSDMGIDLSALAEGLEYAGMSRTIFPVIMAKDVIVANLVVLFLGLTVSVYPAVKAARFRPVQAMRHT